MKFERLGVFQYSHEENTGAYALEDDVTSEIKAERANKIMSIQQEISLEKNTNKIGKSFKVLIDRIEEDYFVGRTFADSPEVDNEVLISAKNNYLRIGDFANISITDAMEYDLIGTLVK